MKKQLFSVCSLLIGIFSITSLELFAQYDNLQSGSLQLILQGKQVMRVEVNGPLHFSELCSENLILSALVPGNYEVVIMLAEERRNRKPIFQEMIRVVPGKRIILEFQENRRHHSHLVVDRNSVSLCNNNNIHRPTYPDNNANWSKKTMNSKEFRQMLNQVRYESFREDKLRIISSVSGYNSFYTAQIQEILTLFSFDDEKLECAKMLARNAIDKQNLYSLSESFSFSSTKDKFYEFINGSNQ